MPTTVPKSPVVLRDWGRFGMALTKNTIQPNWIFCLSMVSSLGCPFIIANCPVIKLLDDLEAFEIDKTKLSTDRGFYSKANIDALLGQHLKPLIRIRTGIKLDWTNLLDHMKELYQFQNYDDNSGVYGITVMTEYHTNQCGDTKRHISGKRRVYLHLSFNNDWHSEDVRVLDKHFAEFYHELQARQHLEAQAKDYAKFFEVKATPKRGHQVTPKDEAVKQAKEFCR